ncbi:MAG: MarR family winged helix-turn-helix transcriptional regulator [Nitrospinota bacterium]|nr:MarR family winged helix-turn-helix transcriptional regulator [Nitrospinota bacterium]
MNVKDPAVLAGEMASSCVATRARLISRSITAIFDEALKGSGVKVSQVNLMVMVFNLGQARSSDICRIMKMDASTLSRNVDRMKKKGWLDSRHEDGARSMIVSITPAGEQLLVEIYPQWKEAQRRSVDLLDVEGMESVFSLSSRIWAQK